MTELTGSGFYLSGLRTHGNGLINPAAMVQGLAACLPENVTLFEDSPSNAVTVDHPLRLQGENGAVSAPGLILATSCFSRTRVSAGTVSSPSPPSRACRNRFPSPCAGTWAGEGEFALLPAHPNGSTVRLDRNGQLLMRNTISYARKKHFDAAHLADVERAHRAAIGTRWPALADIEFEGTWGGMLGFTHNDGTIWGEIGANVHAVIFLPTRRR